MTKQTDLSQVRLNTKILFDAVRCNFNNIVVQHPFITSPFTMSKNNELLDLREPVNFTQARQEFFKTIDSVNLFYLYNLVNSAWKLTWLKFVKDYLSKKDFSELLADAWVSQDNPNMDANVSRRTAISWFKHASKKDLMTDVDYAYWLNIPDVITLYRGVSEGRIDLGLSWTADIEKAKWFMNRFSNFNKSGYLLQATVDKKHILAYLNTRGEDEYVTDVYAIKDKIIRIS